MNNPARLIEFFYQPDECSSSRWREGRDVDALPYNIAYGASPDLSRRLDRQKIRATLTHINDTQVGHGMMLA